MRCLSLEEKSEAWQILKSVDVEEVKAQILSVKIMIIPLYGCPEDMKGSSPCSFKYLLIMLKA